MAQSFGLTWWGQRWLDSLTHIDFANRIPRGARYARNGSVREVVFDKGGVVKARVKGSRPSPYKIEIKVPQFSEAGKKALVKDLSTHPAILSRLMNNELPQEVLPMAVKCGLKVFPSSWKDLGMKCSCPDWAVPCKHIVAVIYKVSQEIDNDPFLVFRMHGLDIPLEIESLGVKLNCGRTLSVEKTSEAFVLAGKTSDIKPCAPDFSIIPDLTDKLIDILEEDPPFEKGFREKYRKLLHRAQRSLAKQAPKDLLLNPVRASSDIRIVFYPDFEILGEVYDFGGKTGKLQSGILIEAFREWENKDRSMMQPSAHLLYMIYRTAVSLVLKGCVVPKIMMTDDEDYKIIWEPAMMDGVVSALVKNLSDASGDSLAVNAKGRALQNGATLVLEAFITLLIQENVTPQDHDLSDMFFCGNICSFDAIGEKGIPGSIKAWLSSFRIASSGYKPFLKADDVGEGFAIDFGFEIKGREVALRNILSRKTYENDRFKMLQQLGIVLRHVQGASTWVDSGAKEPMKMTDRHFFDFLRDIIPVVRLLSVKVVLPKGLETLIHPRPSLRITKKVSSGKSFFRADDLLDFNWAVAIGDEMIDNADFTKLLQNAHGLIRFKSSYFCVDDDDLVRLNKAFSSAKGPGKMRLMQAALSGEFEGAQVSLSSDVRELIRELTTIEDIDVPRGIDARLRPYQIRGYSWMYKNFRLGFGSIIADDMGLGKTLQVITLLQKLKEEGALESKKALIIVPTGLLVNWEAELDRFAPSLSHARYHGIGRSIKDFNADILLTSYGVLRSDADTIGKLKWEVEIIDEAQNIKNTTAAQTSAVKSIPAEVKIAMSGTPVENRLSEYWSIMDFANKGYLDTAKRFREQYAAPIEQEGDKACVERFRRVTAPFIIRRLKTDKSIISDLPDKVTRNYTPSLTPSQAALYQQVVQEYMSTLEGAQNESLFKRQGIVLQMILALKQICNHPSLFLKDGKEETSLSGKCEMLIDLVRSIMESGEKVLIFTQFKEMGDLLSNIICRELNVDPLFYHGGCSLKQRTEMIDRFQNVKSERIFILSLKAAGTGLNLTAASHVIHFDLWWNPAVEAQATDRAYRIGQHKNVLVTRFVTAGTFEEKIDRMISEKKALANLTVTSGESWIGKLSDSELHEIFDYQ